MVGYLVWASKMCCFHSNHWSICCNGSWLRRNLGHTCVYALGQLKEWHLCFCCFPTSLDGLHKSLGGFQECSSVDTSCIQSYRYIDCMDFIWINWVHAHIVHLDNGFVLSAQDVLGIFILFSLSFSSS